jgi:hypothetical protein
MTIKTLFEKHECGNDQIWHNDKRKWVNEDDDIELEYAIVFGDPGGDTYLKVFNSEQEFNNGLRSHIISGDTGCDFATVIYVIIKNGEKYIPQVI